MTSKDFYNSEPEHHFLDVRVDLTLNGRKVIITNSRSWPKIVLKISLLRYIFFRLGPERNLAKEILRAAADAFKYGMYRRHMINLWQKNLKEIKW